MEHAWLDSLSEDWVSQPRSAGSPAPSLPSLPNSTADLSDLRSTSRTQKSNPKKQPWAAIPDSSNSPLSERSQNEANLPLSQRGMRQPSKLRVELTSSARGRRLSRRMSASTTQSNKASTIHHKSASLSPKKLNETPEWKRRLLHGDVAYGEQRDLFSPAGLENIFRAPPSQTPSPIKLPIRTFGDGSIIMPSSPPIYNTGRTRSQTGPFGDMDEIPVEEEAREEEARYRQQPRAMTYKLMDSDGSEFSRDDLSRSSSFQPRMARSQVDRKNKRVLSELGSSVADRSNDLDKGGRTVSGQSDIRNEDLSPIYISRHNTTDRNNDYTPSSVAPDELKRRLEKVQEEDNPIPTVEISDNTSHALPVDETTETDDFVHDGRFVNVRRGGLSQEGSFQKRMLSPSSLPAIDESAMLPEESIQASTPKQLPNVRKTRVSEENSPPQTVQLPPAEPETPPPSSPAKSIGKEQKSNSGSPLKLFGTHDTFTNQTLLRRLSQFEGNLEEKGNSLLANLTSESIRTDLNDAFVAASSPEKTSKQQPQSRQRSSKKINSFGEGELDAFQFSEDLTYDSVRPRAEDGDDDNKENISLSTLNPNSQVPFRFHLEPSPALEEDVVVHRRGKYTTTTTTTEETIKTKIGVRPGTASSSGSSTEIPTSQTLENLQTPRKQNGDSEGKRLPKSPLKDPTPKRRRTLHETEMTWTEEGTAEPDSTRETHQQMQSVLSRKRKDARHDDDQQAANPKVLAMRQILRPRTPTPSQRSSQQRETAPFLDIGQTSTERARKVQEKKIAQVQAELDSTDPVKYPMTLGKGPPVQNESRKGSVTTQDFLDEAKKIMAGIRGKARSGLTSVEESESENDRIQSSQEVTQEDEFEDSYQESTKEPFSRPPSREGQPLQRLPRKQEDPAVLDHLRKYQEMSDMNYIMASSMKSITMMKEAAQTAKDIERLTEETISRSSGRIVQDTIQSEPPNIIISENPDSLHKRKYSRSTLHNSTEEHHEPEYPSNGSNASQSTTSSIPTGSSRGSDSRRVIAPETVSHLIPEELAGMVFDRELNKWIKRKTVSGQSVGGNFLPSDETEEDPFGDIPDLSVDETQERLRLKAVAAKKKEDARVSEQLYPPSGSNAQQEAGQDIFDNHRSLRSAAGRSSASEPSKGTEHTSSDSGTTRLTSWGEESTSTTKARHQMSNGASNHSSPRRHEAQEVVEEEVEREISILEDRVDSSPHRRRNVTITFSSPLASIIQAPGYDEETKHEHQPEQGSESDNDEFGNDSVIVSKRRSSQRTSSGKIRSAFRSTSRAASRRLSLGGHQFSARPVSRIDEQDEESFHKLGSDPDQSISVLVTATAPSNSRLASSVVLATPGRPSHEIGTLTLTPLSDFTVHYADISLGLDVSYVEKGQRHVLGNGEKRALSLSIKELVEKITEVEPFEPFWEDLKELDLKEKRLTNLHKLDEFCEHLEELNVSHNQIGQLDGIPRTVRHLRISHNYLTDLAAWGHLSNLQYIDVSNNELESLSALRSLVHLRSIRADNNKLQSLEGIGQLDGLLSLRCRGNQIRLINGLGTRLQRLADLDLKDNHIADVCNLHELQSLSSLNLQGNYLDNFSIDDSEAMPNLKHLKLCGNNLTSIDVSRFPNLRLLYLDENRLGTVNGLLKTKHLDSLSMREQQAGAVLNPSFLSQAFEVRKLFLSGNLLHTFDPKVDFLNLQYLELANCGLESLPEYFGQLVANTRVLNLNFNALRDLAPLLGIVRLKKLHVSGNRLQKLRATTDVLNQFRSMTIADLRGNPLTLGFYTPMVESTVVVREGMDGQQEKEPFTLGPADAERDGKYAVRLDMQTRLLRRTYEMMVLRGCERLKVLDGLVADRGVMTSEDEVWEELVRRGILLVNPEKAQRIKERKESEDGEEGVCETLRKDTVGVEEQRTGSEERWQAEDSFA